MKCPKCGYNSFECYDSCIKCSHDLTAHKMNYGLKPIVFQKEIRAAMAAALATETAAAAAPEQPAEQPVDLFSFDLPDDEPAAATKDEAAKDDHFSFSEKPATPNPDSMGTFSIDNEHTLDAHKSAGVFENLLETTTHHGTSESTLSSSQQTTVQGEYDLSNFSWDDTPDTAVSGAKKPVDDFDSLFGDIEGSIKK
ncbi:MAG: hypothetical protein HXX11_08335 [Desulfuromonadales bacterium]|nr:hypothetical protein [Desulfuromonadales bacterium]